MVLADTWTRQGHVWRSKLSVTFAPIHLRVRKLNLRRGRVLRPPKKRPATAGCGALSWQRVGASAMECHERWQARVVKHVEPFQFLNKRCGIIAGMAQPILLADCLHMAVDVGMFSGELSSISVRLSGRHVHFYWQFHLSLMRQC